jgi:hypothetical protein
MLKRLTEAHESPRAAPWSVSDAPAPFMERMMRAIVGVEIPIDRLDGKLKASQDEAWPDRQGTVRGLRAQACDAARAMAALGLSPRCPAPHPTGTNGDQESTSNGTRSFRPSVLLRSTRWQT